MDNYELKLEYVLADLAKLGAGIGNHSNKYAKIIRLTTLLFGRYVAYNQSEFTGEKAPEKYKILVKALRTSINTLTKPIDSYKQCTENLRTFSLFTEQNSAWFNISEQIESETNLGIKEVERNSIRFEKPWIDEINYISSLRIFIIAVSDKKSGRPGFYYPIFEALDDKVQDFVHYHMLFPGEPGPGGLPETDNILEALKMYMGELRQIMQQILKENIELRNELLKNKNAHEPEFLYATWQLAAVRMSKAVFKDPDDNEDDIIVRGALDRFLYEMKKKKADPRSYGVPDEISASHIYKYKNGNLVVVTTAQIKTAYGHFSRL